MLGRDLLNVVRQTGIEDVEVTLRTADEDLTILWVVINAETVETKEEALNFLCASKQQSNDTLLTIELVKHSLVIATWSGRRVERMPLGRHLFALLLLLTQPSN